MFIILNLECIRYEYKYIYIRPPKSKPNFCPTPAESGATPAESGPTPAESGPLLWSPVPLWWSPVTPSGISGALKSTAGMGPEWHWNETRM